MPSVAITAADIEVGVGAPARLSVGDGDGTRTLEVWVCGTAGGARIVQLPASALLGVAWDEGYPASAQIVVDRYAKTGGGTFWVDQIVPYQTEIQIVWEGQVRFWGPVLAAPETVGAPSVTVSCADASWYLGHKLVNSATRRQFLGRVTRNEKFTDGLSQWSGSGLTAVVGGGISGSSAVDIADGGWITQDVVVDRDTATVLSVRAEILWSTPGPGLTLFVSEPPISRSTAEATADTNPADEWSRLQTNAKLVRLSGPVTLRVTLRNDSGGTVRVDEIIGQMVHTNARRPPMRLQSPSLAAGSLIGRAAPYYNLTAIIDPDAPGRKVEPVWNQRDDMMVSESLRGCTDRDDGVELRCVYTATSRAIEAFPVVGVEHDPGDVTFRFEGGTGAGASGNVAAGNVDDGAAGVPSTRFAARSETGATGIAENLAALNGLLLESMEQLPLAGGGLQGYAQAKLAAGLNKVSSLSLSVTDIALVSALRRGDRVRLVIDDGPTQHDGLVRIEEMKVAVADAVSCQVTVSTWVDPGSLPKMPRASSQPIAPATTEQTLIGHDRRLYDVERRLNAAPEGDGIEALWELADVVVGDSSVDADPGDVLTFDGSETTDEYPYGRWVPAPPAGGGGNAPYATLSFTGLFDGSTVSEVETDWSYHADGYEISRAADGNEGLGYVAEVSAAGIYLIEAQATMTSWGGGPPPMPVVPPVVEAYMTGGFFHGQWRNEGDDNGTCREAFRVAAEDHASMHMPLADNMTVAIDVLSMGSATEVRWRLQVALYHAAPIDNGDCAV